MTRQQPARVPRVLAKHDVGGAQLREDAQRHVLEVADRRGADDERHQPRSKVACSCQWRPSTDVKRTTDSARDASGSSGSTSVALSSSCDWATVRGGMIDEYDPPYGGQSGKRATIASVIATNGSAGSGASQSTPGKRSTRVKITSNGSKGASAFAISTASPGA